MSCWRRRLPVALLIWRNAIRSAVEEAAWSAIGGRMNFPSRHPLNQSFRRSVISQADIILAVEMNDIFGTLNAFSDRIARASRPATKKGAKIITLGLRDTYTKSNYQDFGRYQDVDLAIAGDGE